ncbi:hypothetical protein PanWU01x14_357120, partial [Parasponia andersonii]
PGQVYGGINERFAATGLARHRSESSGVAADGYKGFDGRVFELDCLSKCGELCEVGRGDGDVVGLGIEIGESIK